MATTRKTLLDRVKDTEDSAAWQEFYDLYRPILYKFACEYGANSDAAREIAQDCMGRLSRRMRTFVYQPGKKPGRFRAYLKRLVHNRVIDWWEKQLPQGGTRVMKGLAGNPGTSPGARLDEIWLNEHIRHCMRQIGKRMRRPERYEAFKLRVINNWPVPRVAEKLSMTAKEVHEAKAFGLKLLKEMMESLLDGSTWVLPGGKS